MAHAGDIAQNKRRENLIKHADLARLSRKLVVLDQDVPLNVGLDGLHFQPNDGPRLIAFLKAMELNTLTRKIAELTKTDIETVESAWVNVEGYQPAHELDPSILGSGQSLPQADSAKTLEKKQKTLAEVRIAAGENAKINPDHYECVRDLARLKEWIHAIYESGLVAIDTETNSLDAIRAELVGISLASEPGKACYIPLTHKSGLDDLLGGGLVEHQIALKDALALLKPVLEDESILKIGQNLKYDWHLFNRHNIQINPIDDTMLISYVLDSGMDDFGGSGGHGMDALAKRWLNHQCITFKQLTGSGRSSITFDFVDLEAATRYAAEDADITLRLWRLLKPRLVSEGLVSVYERLERPLIAVLGRMETRGILVDRKILLQLSNDFSNRADGLEKEIYELAGERFNVGSPKQLGDILFGKLGLPGGGKTKTGQWSTSAQILEKLATDNHKLPLKVTQWRQLTKLKTTYTDALPSFINPETGRVHTSYALASTSTGRLSSSSPNLQNIPVRTTEGREIRTAFITTSAYKLVSADYSQIELRILAHVADIPQLKQAFFDGIDIHAMTAAEIFAVPVKGMDPMVRRSAKAINFGIIYGISSFGLANQLGISRSEAGDYIHKYFERFPGIQDYMEETKQICRGQGICGDNFWPSCSLSRYLFFQTTAAFF